MTVLALAALHDAWKKANRHHRDITPGNIILYNDSSQSMKRGPRLLVRKGYLVDWDLSWDFKSGRALSIPVSVRYQYL